MRPSRGMGIMKKSKMPDKIGLYANINAKKKRIAAGSGEKMRKPGSKGAPTEDAFVQSAKTAKMAKGGKWIQSAIKKPGALRAELGAKKGKPIPAGKLAKAAKAPGKLGQRARFAQVLKGMRKK